MSREDLMKDYIPVSERIEAFYAKYPDGSLQSEVVAMTDTLIAMKAVAYRNPEDPRPGVGHSSIEVPGKTPYTRGSEMENCETSAWGRAIAALGFEIKRGIASAEEVRNKQDDTPREIKPRPQVVRDDQALPAPDDFPWDGLVEQSTASSGAGLNARDFWARADDAGLDRKAVSNVAKSMFGASKWKVNDLTDEERAALWAEMAPVPA